MTTETGLLAMIAVAWVLQIWMSSSQMRRFNKRSHELAKTGDFMSVGLAGTTYRRKVYTILVVDREGTVTAAEELAGFTVFANTRPLHGVVGLPLDEVGVGAAPTGLTDKAWASLGHAAGFLRPKIDNPSPGEDVGSQPTSGGDMA
jgi:DNA-binding transcriptional regulator of glucitol operon